MIHAKLLRNCYLGHIPAGQLHCLTAGMLQLPLIDKMQAQKCHNPIISNHCPHQSLWSSHPHSLPSLTIVPATSIEKETMTVAWLRITLLHSIWCYNAACILSLHVFVHVYLTNVRTKNFRPQLFACAVTANLTKPIVSIFRPISINLNQEFLFSIESIVPRYFPEIYLGYFGLCKSCMHRRRGGKTGHDKTPQHIKASHNETKTKTKPEMITHAKTRHSITQHLLKTQYYVISQHIMTKHMIT